MKFNFTKMFNNSSFKNIRCPSIIGCTRGDFCHFSHVVERVRNDTISNEIVQTKKKIKLSTLEPFETAMQGIIKTIPETLLKPILPPFEAISISTPKTIEQSSFTLDNPPRMKSDINSKISKEHRQKVLTQFYTQFKRIYDSILPETPFLAHEHAVKQELHVHSLASKKTYTTLSVGILTRLKKRLVAVSITDIGIDSEYIERRIPLTLAQVNAFICTVESLIDNGYPFDGVFQFPFYQKLDPNCDRCDELYSNSVCVFHSGYIMNQRSDSNYSLASFMF